MSINININLHSYHNLGKRYKVDFNSEEALGLIQELTLLNNHTKKYIIFENQPIGYILNFNVHDLSKDFMGFEQIAYYLFLKYLAKYDLNTVPIEKINICLDKYRLYPKNSNYKDFKVGYGGLEAFEFLNNVEGVNV